MTRPEPIYVVYRRVFESPNVPLMRLRGFNRYNPDRWYGLLSARGRSLLPRLPAELVPPQAAYDIGRGVNLRSVVICLPP